jgi:hypothetical protein
MATDVQIDQRGQSLEYGEPIQPGNADGLVVTRQRGLPPAPPAVFDSLRDAMPIIQGDPNLLTVRNAGPHVSTRIGADGITWEADRRADDHIMRADHALSDPEAMPPGIERTNTPLPAPSAFGEMSAVQQREAVKQAAIAAGFVVSDAPVFETKRAPGTFVAQPVQPFDVIASDEGAHDPRDKGDKGPMVFSASDLPVVKRRAIVPVTTTPAPTARVKGKK